MTNPIKPKFVAGSFLLAAAFVCAEAKNFGYELGPKPGALSALLALSGIAFLVVGKKAAYTYG